MLCSVCEAWQRLQACQAPAGSQRLIGRLAVFDLQMTCKGNVALDMPGALAAARSGGCFAKTYHSIQAGTQLRPLALEQLLHMDTGGPARCRHELYSVMRRAVYLVTTHSRPNLSDMGSDHCCCWQPSYGLFNHDDLMTCPRAHQARRLTRDLPQWQLQQTL